MATARLDIKLDKAVKDKAEKAYALLGLGSLTEYIVKLMNEDASRVIAEHETTVIADDMFDRFMQACQSVRPPNKALRDAAAFTKKHCLAQKYFKEEISTFHQT